ncbi:MAG: hypothetical protein JXC36_02110, partial [Candidatus Atribacteria bacterium]|nr:hypothetical protein [Candidatus Atribacteria bacterium]
WSISIYEEDPFNDCCETICVEPKETCSGTACPIECITECLAGEKYYIVTNLVDQVGIEQEYYATVEIDTSCNVSVYEHEANVLMDQCTDWSNGYLSEDDTFGDCGILID